MKQKKSKQLNIRIDKDLFDKVKKIAVRDDRTVSYIIKKIIKKHINKNKLL